MTFEELDQLRRTDNAKRRRDAVIAAYDAALDEAERALDDGWSLVDRLRRELKDSEGRRILAERELTGKIMGNAALRADLNEAADRIAHLQERIKFFEGVGSQRSPGSSDLG